MVFSPDNFIIDVALEDEFQAWLSQLPPSVIEPVETVDDDNQRHFRQALWTVFSQTGQVPLAGDHSLEYVVDLLSLASSLMPATFKPSQVSLSDIAMAKAKGYSSQYLYGKFVADISSVNLPPTEVTAILQTAQTFWLAHITRLQLNFNQRERVADYLKDAKARIGILTALTCRLATLSNGVVDKEVTDLTSTIGETLGVVSQIFTDVALTHDALDFRTRIMSGHYPLSLLFAFEEEHDWFKRFFGSSQKPTADQFEVARKLTIQAGETGALNLAQELISQTRLDAESLPVGTVQTQLLQLLTQLEQGSHV